MKTALALASDSMERSVTFDLVIALKDQAAKGCAMQFSDLSMKRNAWQVLRVMDFQGAWVRLAPDTEAQAGGDASGNGGLHAKFKYVQISYLLLGKQVEERQGCLERVLLQTMQETAVNASKKWCFDIKIQ